MKLSKTKIFALAITIVMLLSAAACGNSNTPAPSGSTAPPASSTPPPQTSTPAPADTTQPTSDAKPPEDFRAVGLDWAYDAHGNEQSLTNFWLMYNGDKTATTTLKIDNIQIYVNDVEYNIDYSTLSPQPPSLRTNNANNSFTLYSFFLNQEFEEYAEYRIELDVDDARVKSEVYDNSSPDTTTVPDTSTPPTPDPTPAPGGSSSTASGTPTRADWIGTYVNGSVTISLESNIGNMLILKIRQNGSVVFEDFVFIGDPSGNPNDHGWHDDPFKATAEYAPLVLSADYKTVTLTASMVDIKDFSGVYTRQ
jgi:hypothetical protein